MLGCKIQEATRSHLSRSTCSSRGGKKKERKWHLWLELPNWETGASQGGSVIKNLPANAGDTRDASSILGSARPPGEGNDNPLWYSCLENPMGRGAWRATVHGVAESWTWLHDWAHTTPLKFEHLHKSPRDLAKAQMLTEQVGGRPSSQGTPVLLSKDCTWSSDNLDQRSGNYSPWAKSGPQLAFINKVLLKHEIKFYWNLDSILKSRDVTLSTKVCLSKAMVFPVVMYGMWTIKKAECQRIDAFELWCRRRLLRVPWTERRSNQSILNEISPEYSLKGLMLKLKL